MTPDSARIQRTVTVRSGAPPRRWPPHDDGDGGGSERGLAVAFLASVAIWAILTALVIRLI
jgi:hypothetical protein